MKTKFLKVFILATFVLVGIVFFGPNITRAQCGSVTINAEGFSVGYMEPFSVGWGVDWQTWEPTGGTNNYTVTITSGATIVDLYTASTDDNHSTPETDSGLLMVGGGITQETEYVITARVVSDYSCPGGVSASKTITMSLNNPPPLCSITDFHALNPNPAYNTGTNLNFTLSGSFLWTIVMKEGNILPSPSSGTSSNGSLSTGNLTTYQKYRLTCGNVYSEAEVTPGSPNSSPFPYRCSGAGTCINVTDGTGTTADPNCNNSCTPGICTNSLATNFGGPLPCTFPPATCQDDLANNKNMPLPCTYSVIAPKITNVSVPACSNVNYTAYISYSTNSGTNISWINVADNEAMINYHSGQVQPFTLPWVGLSANPVKFPNQIVWPADGSFMFYDNSMFNLAPNTNYWTTVDNSGGARSAKFKWNVPLCPPTPDLKVADGKYYLTPVNGPIMTYGSRIYTLSWGAVTGAVSCTLDGVAVPVTSGTQTGTATSTTKIHTLTCTNATGQSASDSVTVTTPPPPLTFTKTCIPAGNYVTLNWTLPAGYTGGYVRGGLNADISSGLTTTLPITPYTTYSGVSLNTRAANNAWSGPVAYLSTPPNTIGSANIENSFFCPSVPPKVENVAISSKNVIPDNSTEYDITITSNDLIGAKSISNNYVWINLQGENHDIYRGELTWFKSGDPWTTELEGKYCTYTGPETDVNGYAAIQPGGGSEYVHLVRCHTTDAGNMRITTFTVKFDPLFKTPRVDNDISGLTCNKISSAAPQLCTGWTNFNTDFNLVDAPTPTPDLKVADGYFYVTPVDGPIMTYGSRIYTLSWGAVTGAVSCTLDGVAVLVTSGTQTGTATSTTKIHTLTCTNATGQSASDSVTVNVPPGPITITKACSPAGDQVTFNWTLEPGYLRAIIRGGMSADPPDGSSWTLPVVPGQIYTDVFILTRASNGAYSGAVAYVSTPPNTRGLKDVTNTFSCPLPNTIPVVESPTVTSKTAGGATLGAKVTSLGVPASISARGTCWGLTASPETNCLAQGGTTLGIFTHPRTGMLPGTTYHFRGYATNEAGTGYSSDLTFTTISAPLDGVCGTAAKSYPVGASSFGGDTFCSVGTPSPALPAFPVAGSSVSWTCGGVNGGSTPTCTATHVSATFPIVVTTNVIGGIVTSIPGGITCGTTCTYSYSQGSVVTLNAAPISTYWRFDHWAGDCSGTLNKCTLTVNSSKNVTAVFMLREFNYEEF